MVESAALDASRVFVLKPLGMRQTRVRPRPLPIVLTLLLLAACSGRRPAQPSEPPAEEVCVAAELRRRPSGAVRSLLEHRDSRVRARAALAAGRIRDEEALPGLGRLLADEEAGAVAAWSLGRISGGEARLLDCLASPRCRAAQAAARALGSNKRSAAVAAVLAKALSGPSTLAAAAATALGVLARFGGPGAPAEVGGAAGGPLLSALASADAEVRSGAAYALGYVALDRPEGAMAALAPALRDPDALVRSRAARAFGKQRLTAQSLAPLLRDADWRVRVEAARALGIAPGGRTAIEAALPVAAADVARAGIASARWAHVLVALLEAAPAAGVEALSVPAPRELSAPTAAATVSARCAAAQERDRIRGRVEETPNCGLGLEPPWRGRMRAGALAAELASRTSSAAAKATPTPTPTPTSTSTSTPTSTPTSISEGTVTTATVAGDPSTAVRAAFADPDGRVRGAASAAAGPALAADLRALLSDPDPFVVAEAASSLAKDAGAAADSAGDAARAIHRLFAARERPAGDPESDALAALAQLLGAAGARARQALPALLSLEDSDSAYIHSALADALRALGAPAPKLGPALPVPAEAAAGLPGQGPRPRLLRLRTTAGDLFVELRSRDGEAPLTSAAVAALAGRRFYDGLTWHRVVPDFVVQGGDPRGDGDGGPGWALPDEHTPLQFRRGTLGIATNGPETGGSQLFLCHSPQPHLDGRYTVAGELREGGDALDALQLGDIILSASVE